MSIFPAKLSIFLENRDFQRGTICFLRKKCVFPAEIGILPLKPHAFARKQAFSKETCAFPSEKCVFRLENEQNFAFFPALHEKLDDP